MTTKWLFTAILLSLAARAEAATQRRIFREPTACQLGIVEPEGSAGYYVSGCHDVYVLPTGSLTAELKLNDAVLENACPVFEGKYAEVKALMEKAKQAASDLMLLDPENPNDQPRISELSGVASGSINQAILILKSASQYGQSIVGGTIEVQLEARHKLLRQFYMENLALWQAGRLQFLPLPIESLKLMAIEDKNPNTFTLDVSIANPRVPGAKDIYEMVDGRAQATISIGLDQACQFRQQTSEDRKLSAGSLAEVTLSPSFQYNVLVRNSNGIIENRSHSGLILSR